MLVFNAIPYVASREFDSHSRYQLYIDPDRPMARTPDFDSGNESSNLSLGNPLKKGP